MTKRPSINEALTVLKRYSSYNDDCASALEEYYELCAKGQVFLASRLVVEIVHQFNLDNQQKVAANG